MPTDPKIMANYVTDYDSCVIKPEALPIVDAIVRKILTNKGRYENVGNPLGIPWWFIAVIHVLESSGNFSTHLHNGDPLTARTTHVPAGYPKVGEPPFTWEVSATDALTLKGYQGKTYDVANALHRLELYNGWGYRAHGIKTPYLWSFSNQYVKGKYVYDNHFDPEAVSKQCGAAVLLKRLEELKNITITR